MWISKIEYEKLKSQIEKLEKDTLELRQKIEALQNGILNKVCFNSVMKEAYNFELLKYLYEKMGIEQPKSNYNFTRDKPSSNEDRQGNN